MIGVGVHMCMYVCMYVCDPNQNLNDILAVNSPFQTIVIDFSSNL